MPDLPTASSIAKEFFQKEVDSHYIADNSSHSPATLVVLHDACYGHRYARPRTSKASLNTIVERPERIHATTLGVAAAYVRLGGFHSEGKNAPRPNVEPTAIESIPFKIQKSTRTLPLTSQAVTNVHGVRWMEELKIMCDGAESRLALGGRELTRPVLQTGQNEEETRPQLHEGDLYLCSESLNALEGALGGVCEAVDGVFNENAAKRAFVCVRPPGHHCSADYPSGFCWLNNVHVGISYAAMTHGLTHAAIIDFDLHHGDGSQAITWSHNAKVASLPRNASVSKRTAIGYFSLHDINSYPCETGDEEKVRNASLCLENAHGQTIWNVHLQPWKTESEFWGLYAERYSLLLTKAKAFLRTHTDRIRQTPSGLRPKGAIFLSAGFDASEWESPGMQRHKVNVPTDFYARFTQDVVSIAEEESLGVDGRVISVLEGGYSDRALMSGVFSHLSGLSSIHEVQNASGVSDGLGHEMSQRLGTLSLDDDPKEVQESPRKSSAVPIDPRWWAEARLEELENTIHPTSQQVGSKKPRSTAVRTYASNTQSFTAKIIPPSQARRSFSGSGFMGLRRSASSAETRAPTVPPPEVDWTNAAYELSKVLIPTDRQTHSCKPEELNAEASRARRDRLSTIGVPAGIPDTEPKHMQLRDRKSKVPNYVLDEKENKPAVKSNRRKTVAGAEILSQDSAGDPNHSGQSGPGEFKAQSSRRLSIAPTNGDESINSSVVQRVGKIDPNPVSERRLSSSLSIRPSSSVSNRPSEPTAKKSRASSAVRNEQPKPHASRKPPVPRVPSLYSVFSTKDSVSAVDAKRDEGHKPPNEAGERLDELATGIKKMSIKLNVPPRDEREGKPNPAARAPRKQAAAKRTKKTDPATTALPSSIISPRIPTDQIITSHHSDRRDPGKTVATRPKEAEHTNKNPFEPAPFQPPTTQPFTDFPASFRPPTHASIPALVPEPQASFPLAMPLSDPQLPTPEAHVPVSVINPPPPQSTPKRTKDDLPKFTSTSPIPFGDPATRQQPSMDPLVSTPDTKLDNTDILPTGPEEGRRTKNTDAEPEAKTAEQPTTSVVGADIWEVPNTPQPPTP